MPKDAAEMVRLNEIIEEEIDNVDTIQLSQDVEDIDLDADENNNFLAQPDQNETFEIEVMSDSNNINEETSFFYCDY